ncbi:MAG: protein kinase [Anaerolineae bacterium]|nr:protein kinase [Anaerolineae bacterium]
MFEEGQIIANRYKILNELGRGGMGAVYRVQDTQLNRVAALKVLAPHLAWDQKFVQRFSREAQLAASLQHPNIITIFDVNQEDDRHYIAMEFVGGRTLDKVTQTQGLPALPQISVWLNQIAAALDHAHAHRMVHRDVKPANIILRNDGRIVLTDFGIAWHRDSTRITTEQGSVGTPFYASPEQIKGQEPTVQSDIYSLGVVIYELLAGQPPFVGDTMAVLYAHVHEPLPSIRAARPDVPKAVEKVLAQALAKDPATRFASAGALARAFAAACGVSGEVGQYTPPPISAQGTVPDEPPTTVWDSSVLGPYPAPNKKRRKSNLLVVAAALLAVACVAGMVTTVVLLGRDKEPETGTATAIAGEGQMKISLEVKKTTIPAATPTTPVVTVAKPISKITSTESSEGGKELPRPGDATPTGEMAAGIAGEKWQPLTSNLNLPGDTRQEHLTLAADSSGRLAVGWLQPETGLLVTASEDRGQNWTAARRIPITTNRPDEAILTPLADNWLVYDEQGRLFAVWVEKSGGTTKVFSSLSPNNGGSWKAPVVVNDESRPADRYGANLISLGSERLGAAWVETKGASFDLYFAASQKDSETWSSNEKLAGSGSPIIPGNVVRFEDSLCLAWVEQNEDRDQLYMITSRDLGQTWSAPQKIITETGTTYSPPYLTALAEDKFLMIVSSQAGQGEDDQQSGVLAALLETGAGSHPELNWLSDDNGKQAGRWEDVSLVRGDNNVFYATWLDDRDGELKAYLSRSINGQQWSPNIPLTISRNRLVTDLWLAAGPEGAIFAAGHIVTGDEQKTAQPFLAQSSPNPELELANLPTATPLPTKTSPPPSSVNSDGGTYLLTYSKWDGQFHNAYIADTNGKNERLIMHRVAGPSWSPDGKRLFFFGEQGVNQQITIDGRVDCEFGTISGGIVAIDVPPTGDICAVYYGVWSCERKQVDVHLPPGDVCEQAGYRVFQNLDWKEGSARWANVSPDGQAVAYDARPGGDYRIYFRSLADNPLYRFELVGEQGDWSPDGERLVYRSGRDNKQGLWISNRDDSGHINLTLHGTDSFPAWSPDGRAIAFSREVDGNMDIYTINVDGSNLQRLTDAPGPDTLPTYTPGGGIIFRSARSGSWGIWKMNGAGAGQTEIIANAGIHPQEWAKSRMDVQ